MGISLGSAGPIIFRAVLTRFSKTLKGRLDDDCTFSCGFEWIYAGMEANEHLFRKLQDGYRMDKAKYSPDQVDDVMRMCWHTDPNRRPSFDKLEEMLGSQLETSVRRQYIDLNDPHVQSNASRTVESIDYLSMMANVSYANLAGRPPSLQPNQYINVPAAAKNPKSVEWNQF